MARTVMLNSFISCKKCILYTCVLCESNRSMCGLSRSFHPLSQHTHLVAYSRNRGLFIHPVGDACSMIPGGLSLSQVSGTLPPLCMTMGGRHYPCTLAKVKAVLISPCSLPTILTAATPVSPTTSNSSGTSLHPDLSQF